MSRDTTPADTVKPVAVYTFDELITHLHDWHGFTAEDQANDEVGGGAPADMVAEVRALGRDEAIARLPYHYFQGYGTPDCIEAARAKHSEEHAAKLGGYGVPHIHPEGDIR